MTQRPPPGSDAAKERRAGSVDLSGLNDRQRAVREALVAIGEAAYGERWGADMAAAVGRTPKQLRTWVAGRRPVPDAVAAQLPAIAATALADLDRRAEILRRLATEF